MAFKLFYAIFPSPPMRHLDFLTMNEASLMTKFLFNDELRRINKCLIQTYLYSVYLYLYLYIYTYIPI